MTKRQLKHQYKMLKDTVESNPYTQMDYELKKIKYNKYVMQEKLKKVASGIVVAILICLYFNYC